MQTDRPYKWVTNNAWGPQTLVLPRAPWGIKAGPDMCTTKELHVQKHHTLLKHAEALRAD